MPGTHKERLVRYSAFSASFLFLHAADAQLIHTEFDPYLEMENADPLVVDVDDDGAGDISFTIYKSMGSSSGFPSFGLVAEQMGDLEVMVTPFSAVNFSSSIYSVDCYFAAADGIRKLDELVTIDIAENWNTAELMGHGMVCGEYGMWGEQGEWLFDYPSGEVRDYFVGFRINGPVYTYGWIRLRHNGITDYVKDFSIAASPGGGVVTPDLFQHIAPAAQDLNLSAEPLTHKLILNFDGAAYEDSLQEYRVILRNSIYTDEMTATRCEVTEPGRYISVPKTGGSYTVDLSSLTTDWAGNLLEDGATYKAYVYSKFNYPVTLLNGLSGESNIVEYNTTVAVGINGLTSGSEPSIFYYENLLQINSESAAIISVFNMEGKNILQQAIGSGLKSIQINVSPGMYLVEYRNAFTVANKKIIVE